jgi:hypothetical protein
VIAKVSLRSSLVGKADIFFDKLCDFWCPNTLDLIGVDTYEDFKGNLSNDF